MPRFARGRAPRFRSMSPPLDRGRRHGARWVFVTADLQMIEYAKDAKREDWILFRSRKEAKRWIALSIFAREGKIHDLRRQVPFELTTRTPDGLVAVVAKYLADFEYYDEKFERVVEDSKPSGGLREDIYLLKKKWMKLQHGVDILET